MNIFDNSRNSECELINLYELHVSMTKINYKIAMIAFLAVGLLGSVIAFSQNATAETREGKNTLSGEFPTFDSPNVQKAMELAKTMSLEGISEIETKSLQLELENLQAEHAKNIDTDLHKTSLDKQELVIELMLKNTEQKQTVGNGDQFPVNSVYVDDETSELVVGIDAMAYSEDVAKSVLKQVRDVVGNEVDVKVQPFRTAYYSSCSQSSNCEPAQAGVKIAPGFLSSCSLGFKATSGSMNGFVTAGHCNGGSSSGSIGQPNWVWYDNIGTVKDNSLDSYTYFDGMFVESDETISDKIYNNIDVNVAGNASYLDAVIAEGWKTKGVSGVITTSSLTVTIEGNVHRDHALMNKSVIDGDSGGPVYQYLPTTEFVGIISATDGATYTVISKQQNVGSELSGVAWDFS